MNRAPGTTLFWLGMLLLCAMGLTIAAFFSLLALPEQRGLTFYSVIVSTCLGEVVLFGYVAYFLTVPHTVKRPSPAVRMRILYMVVIWFIVVLASGSVAAHPAQADTFFSDKIILWQSILTFLLLTGAFFLHRQDVLIQMRDDAPQRERVHIQSYVGGIDALRDSLRSLSNERVGDAIEIDRLAKRFDTLRTQLLSVSPVAERQTDRLVQPLGTEEIEEQLRQLHESSGKLTSADDEQFGPQMLKVRQHVDDLIALCRRREDVTTF